jgi:hypothetical protein
MLPPGQFPLSRRAARSGKVWHPGRARIQLQTAAQLGGAGLHVAQAAPGRSRYGEPAAVILNFGDQLMMSQPKGARGWAGEMPSDAATGLYVRRCSPDCGREPARWSSKEVGRKLRLVASGGRRIMSLKVAVAF